MAAKKKTKSARKRVVGKKAASADARIRQLEARLRALEANPALALGEVVALVPGTGCRTVRITGNLQIVNGMGRTDRVNGCGNLIVGYDETPPASSGWPTTRSGSHNLIIGRYHSHASYAGLLSGEMSLTTAAAPASCVIGGSEGSANGDRSVVVGGQENKANAPRTVIIGGFDNGSNGGSLSVAVGGTNNRADAPSSQIFGGAHNTTSTPGERIPP